MNNGIGLIGDNRPRPNGHGVGLANIKSRLQLHYGADHSFLIRESERDKVQVTVTLPLQISQVPVQPTARFGA